MMNVIEFNNWVKLGYNTNITPHLITSDDMVAIYRTLEREFEFSIGIDDKDDQIHYIDFEHFKKGLIRITILAKTQSIEAEVKNRQKRNKKSKKSKTSEETVSTLKSSKLKNLEEQISKIEKMQKMKVEDKRISKEFDVSMISKDDVERFFKFLQFDSTDDKYKMDRKITNKEGYSKSIIFEGLEGNYSDVYSQRDNDASYQKSIANDAKYSEIHGKNINEEREDDFNHEIEGAENSEAKDEEPEEKTSKPKVTKKPLVEVSLEELENQPQEPGTTEKIIDPEGKKEEWAVEGE